MAWTLTGESGATMDATARSLATLGAENASLVFRALETDTLDYSIPSANASASDIIVPDLGQSVTLALDGARKFCGHVIDPRITLAGITVQVAGPWWWLEQTPLSSTRTDDEGTSADRPQYVFSEGSLGGMVRTLINAASTAGLPIGAVTATQIPDLYDVPRITLTDMSFAAAIAELLRWCPDAVAWWDYSGTAFPKLNITRRGSMSAKTYTVGTDPLTVGTEIGPRLGLQVARVELPYAERAANGDVQFKTQASGTAAAGKVQIIPIAGPEISDFLPNEGDSQEASTPYKSSTDPATILRYALAGAQQLKEDWTDTALSSTYAPDIITAVFDDPYTSTSTVILTYGQASGVPDNKYGSTENPKIATTIPTGKTAVLFGLGGRTDPPDWLVAQFGLVRWYVNDFLITDSNTSVPPRPGDCPVLDSERRQEIVRTVNPDLFFTSESKNGIGAVARWKHFVRKLRSDDLPIFLVDTADLPGTLHSGTALSGTGSTQIALGSGAATADDAYNGMVIFWTTGGVRYGAVISDYAGSTKIATLAISQQTEKAPASGDSYEIPSPFGHSAASSFSFLGLPTTLATNLLAAQNWIPWSGTIALAAADPDGDNLLNRKFNISGTLAGAGSADAPAREIRYDLFDDSLRIKLGAPARADFQSLVGRIRRSGQDNVVLS